MKGIPVTNVPAPMLSNPPAFILLTLVFAIAAYLRQVSENATKLRNEIRNGVWKHVYPAGAVHTQEKMRCLQKTRDSLAKGARWIICLAILIALRCTVQAVIILFAGYNYETATWIDLALRWCDLILVAWVAVTVLILAIMHQINRMEDAFVRRLEELTQSQPSEAADSALA